MAGTAPPLTDAQIAALAGGGSSGPNTQIVQDDDGNYILVDKDTGKKTPLGIKGRAPADPTKNRVLASGSSPSDKYIVTFDDQGNVQTVPNPNYTPPTVTPKDTVPGTGTPGSGNPADPSGPRYQAPTPDIPVDVYSAQTARAAQEETARQNATKNAADAADLASKNTTAQLKAYQDELQAQIDAGKLNNSQAIAMFDAQVSMLTAAQNEGDNAVKYAQAANANRVGPQFGQHFADALSGRGVNFTGADFTYPTPDYQAIARKGAAAALAHLSPYAASIAGTMAPPGGYAGSGGAYAGPVVTEAANSVASAPVSPQFTAPHPPFAGYGAYRPGG